MNKTLKKFIIGNVIVFLCVIGFLIYALLTVGKEGYECVFYRSTGLICPGCGGTRAVISLLKLDFISAIKYNVAVPFGAFVYLYYNIRGIIEAKRENWELTRITLHWLPTFMKTFCINIRIHFYKNKKIKFISKIS